MADPRRRRCGARPDPYLAPDGMPLRAWTSGCELPRGHEFAHLIGGYEWHERESSAVRLTERPSRGRPARSGGSTRGLSGAMARLLRAARSTGGGEGSGASAATRPDTAGRAGAFSRLEAAWRGYLSAARSADHERREEL